MSIAAILMVADSNPPAFCLFAKRIAAAVMGSGEAHGCERGAEARDWLGGGFHRFVVNGKPLRDPPLGGLLQRDRIPCEEWRADGAGDAHPALGEAPQKGADDARTPDAPPRSTQAR